VLVEINERHQQVKELEKSLLELHQMFLDMAVLIEQQGVQLDNIEKQARGRPAGRRDVPTHVHNFAPSHSPLPPSASLHSLQSALAPNPWPQPFYPDPQVSRAAEHVQQGTVHLQRAKTLQKNTRKWMCCALVILLIVAAIIVIAILKPWQNKKSASPTANPIGR